MSRVLLHGKYDFVIVGSGLFGATVARQAVDAGNSVLVIERRAHIGGNCWSFKMAGIDIHAYGPHSLHTNDKAVWDWFSKYADLTPCILSPVANYRGSLYSLPFNMHTFYELWGVRTPEEAREKIEEQRVPIENPANLEEHVLSMVGRDVYERLVKGYTEKQYGKPCSDLPASLIARMPLLLTFDNDYNHKKYQGIPEDGWGAFFDRLLEGVEVVTGVDYLKHRDELESLADRVVFTGAIDEYYGYRFGPLEYRGRRFEHEELETDNFQGCALMNYTDAETPWLRTIEHKHFIGTKTPTTVVTKELATSWQPGDEPYYTVNDEANQARYDRYRELASQDGKVVFGGRLGEYRYYTMDDTVKSAFACWGSLVKKGDQR